ncbi:MAG TPA: GNAT family N-acetyltransferase [Candidatus Acidoferrales bacterium]|nr:GNAT family N-acetyltransferase [Candidatus Acidoferrales bacterium]
MPTTQPQSDIIVRPLRESEFAEADRIVRLAFATFLNLPSGDPRHPPDNDYVRSRWTADPDAVVAAEHAGKLIGTNFAANWGSFGFFGPLTVEPAYWNSGVAQMLLAPTMEIFRRWGQRHLGLYTFAHSPKHMALYQKFGFWPRDLVAIMSKETPATPPVPPKNSAAYEIARVSEVGSHEADLAEFVAACAGLTNAIFEGLDLEREIRSVDSQKLGDTILVWDESDLTAFAICHTGPGSEAGSAACYVKFAAVRRDGRAAESFNRLLDAVEAYAREKSSPKITAGVNLARREAFQALRARGFRTEMQGVAMETGDAASGYNRAGNYVLDDWR